MVIRISKISVEGEDWSDRRERGRLLWSGWTLREQKRDFFLDKKGEVHRVIASKVSDFRGVGLRGRFPYVVEDNVYR